MLWVTITMVTSSASSAIVSSIRRVDVGSSAEHGSSISSTRGLTASDRAMHSRCCWPPDSAAARARRAGPGPRSRGRPCSRHSSTSVVLVGAVGLGAGELQARRARCRGSTSPGTGWASGTPCRSARRASVSLRSGVVDVLAVEQHLAGQRGAGHQLVHPVEDPQERRLAAARRADQRGDLAGAHGRARPGRAPGGRRTRQLTSRASRVGESLGRDSRRSGIRDLRLRLCFGGDRGIVGRGGLDHRDHLRRVGRRHRGSLSIGVWECD